LIEVHLAVTPTLSSCLAQRNLRVASSGAGSTTTVNVFVSADLVTVSGTLKQIPFIVVLRAPLPHLLVENELVVAVAAG
jgi:hypothetical protein